MTRRQKWSAFLASLLAALGIYFRPAPPPAPVPTPTPTATATTTALPTAQPTLAPLPTPTPAPTVAQCPLPPSGSKCQFAPNITITSAWEHRVRVAQAGAELNGFVVNGYVKDAKKYLDEVARILRLDGLCSINGRDGGHTDDDEVWVRDSIGFSEHFDLIVGDGRVWTHYAARCSPARF